MGSGWVGLGWVGLCRLRPSCILNSQKKKTKIGVFYFTHLSCGFFLSLDFIFVFTIFILKKNQFYSSILNLFGIELYNFFNLFFMRLSHTHDLNRKFGKLTQIYFF